MVPVERTDEFPASRLRSCVGVNHTTGNVTAAGDGVVEGGDGEAGLHPTVDGVAHDPVGVHVLERAQVQLALTSPVLGDVTDPQLVRVLCGELVPGPALLISDGAQVVVDRRTRLLAVAAALLPER